MSEQPMENNVGFQPGAISPTCPNGQFYTVRSGDTMFFIAKRNNISLQELINANPQISDPNTIYPGQIICIPLAPPIAPIVPTVPCPSNQIYQVVGGDTMYDIARRYGINLDDLIAANPQIPDPNLIFPGQEICIPLPPVVAPVPIPAPGACFNGTLYTVRTGDTLFEIARANNIMLANLIAANPQIVDPNLIYPGQVICIPAPAVEIPFAPQPVQCPMPAPPQIEPIQQPMPMPLPRPVCPIEQPMPLPAIPAIPAPVMPCPVRPGMMYPMPVYVVVPWDECPHRVKKRKHERRRRRCR